MIVHMFSILGKSNLSTPFIKKVENFRKACYTGGKFQYQGVFFMNEYEQKMQEREKKNGFMRHNHIEMESVERDRAVFRLTIRPESCNPYGMVHGGAIYTLADNATGVAVHTDGRSYVTQTTSFHFLRNQAAGTVRATAYVRHRGHSTVLAAVDITGDDGRLLATGEFTFFCVDPALMEEKAQKSRNGQ
jgi:acyl-CoA thioesterase